LYIYTVVKKTATFMLCILCSIKSNKSDQYQLSFVTGICVLYFYCYSALVEVD